LIGDERPYEKCCLQVVDITESRAADFAAQVNKVREATSAVVRQINSHPLGGVDYEAFPQQEEALKVRKQRQ